MESEKNLNTCAKIVYFMKKNVETCQFAVTGMGLGPIDFISRHVMKFLLHLSKINAQGKSASAVSVKLWGEKTERLIKWRG
jgi:hypothetical protein